MKEKVKTILNKTIYLWEIICVVLLAIFSYLLMTTKYYNGYWARIYLFPTIILSILTIIIIIYNVKNNKKRLEMHFLTFMIPIAIFYMVFMLPSYAPDEISHIWRTYDISQGNLFTRQYEDGMTKGIDVPKSLSEANHNILNKYNVLNEVLTSKADYQETVNVISTAQTYPFILYIPAALVFFIVRLINIPIIWGIYIAKMVNLIIFLLGGYYAIKKIPFGKYILFTCLFLPMVITQAISLSADSIINTVIFFYIAYTISLIFQEERINLKQKILYMLLIIFISLAKMIYIPLIGLGFLFVTSKKMGKKSKIIILIIGTLICCTFVFANYMYTSQLKYEDAMQYNETNNVEMVGQLKYLMSNPMNYLKMITNTISTLGGFYINSMIGYRLGWLNINIPDVIIIIFSALLVISPLIENNKVAFSKKQKYWVALLAVGTIILMMTVTYLLWTPVGNDVAQGIQGRYLIPILPLVLLVISKKQNYVEIKNIDIKLSIMLSILNALTVFVIFEFFIF